MDLLRGLSAFSLTVALLVAQDLVQDAWLCLENDEKGIKAGKSQDLKSVLGSVWQLLLLQACCHERTGDLSLVVIPILTISKRKHRKGPNSAIKINKIIIYI